MTQNELVLEHLLQGHHTLYFNNHPMANVDFNWICEQLAGAGFQGTYCRLRGFWRRKKDIHNPSEFYIFRNLESFLESNDKNEIEKTLTHLRYLRQTGQEAVQCFFTTKDPAPLVGVHNLNWTLNDVMVYIAAQTP